MALRVAMSFGAGAGAMVFGKHFTEPAEQLWAALVEKVREAETGRENNARKVENAWRRHAAREGAQGGNTGSRPHHRCSVRARSMPDRRKGGGMAGSARLVGWVSSCTKAGGRVDSHSMLRRVSHNAHHAHMCVMCSSRSSPRSRPPARTCRRRWRGLRCGGGGGGGGGGVDLKTGVVL